jgi:hypothetical protein
MVSSCPLQGRQWVPPWFLAFKPQLFPKHRLSAFCYWRSMSFPRRMPLCPLSPNWLQLLLAQQPFFQLKGFLRLQQQLTSHSRFVRFG